MNIETFIKELEKLNIKPTEKNLENLRIYKDLLITYNQKFNLTAIKTEEEIYLKHFYDSLTLTKGISLDGILKLLDIGTGAGFPGLVLKIFYPNLEITLLDSNHKKIMFLETVIKALNLTNITCLNTRAESLPSEYREYFDIVTSRAVAQLRILSELSIPYLKVNGTLIAYKGKRANEEIEDAKNAFKILNAKIANVQHEFIDLTNERNNLFIIKTAECDKKFPRNYSLIKKKPL